MENLVPVETAEDYEYWFDLAYEVGFDHGFKNEPRVKDTGDLGWIYNAGYDDGKASQ